MSIHHSLKYGKSIIRAAVDNGHLWIAAADLYAAGRRPIDRTALARMSAGHLALMAFPAGDNPVRLTAVSPLGAVTIAKTLEAPANRILDAWVRREANQLADELGLPRLEMTLLADNTLPVKPRRSSDDIFVWWDLRGFAAPPVRNDPDYSNPALYDDVYDPEAPTAAPGVLEALRVARDAR